MNIKQHRTPTYTNEVMKQETSMLKERKHMNKMTGDHKLPEQENGMATAM